MNTANPTFRGNEAGVAMHGWSGSPGLLSASNNLLPKRQRLSLPIWFTKTGSLLSLDLFQSLDGTSEGHRAEWIWPGPTQSTWAVREPSTAVLVPPLALLDQLARCLAFNHCQKLLMAFGFGLMACNQKYSDVLILGNRLHFEHQSAHQAPCFMIADLVIKMHRNGCVDDHQRCVCDRNFSCQTFD